MKVTWPFPHSQPIPSGRKERARDWLAEVVDGIRDKEDESGDESSDEGSDITKVESRDVKSNLESDLSEVENAQFNEMEIDKLLGDTLVVDVTGN